MWNYLHSRVMLYRGVRWYGTRCLGEVRGRYGAQGTGVQGRYGAGTGQVQCTRYARYNSGTCLVHARGTLKGTLGTLQGYVGYVSRVTLQGYAGYASKVCWGRFKHRKGN